MPKATTIPENETPRERFVRLAQARTTTVLQGLSLLEKLANHNTYEYTQEDIAKINATITERLKSTIESLSAGKAKSFSL